MFVGTWGYAVELYAAWPTAMLGGVKWCVGTRVDDRTCQSLPRDWMYRSAVFAEFGSGDTQRCLIAHHFAFVATWTRVDAATDPWCGAARFAIHLLLLLAAEGAHVSDPHGELRWVALWCLVLEGGLGSAWCLAWLRAGPYLDHGLYAAMALVLVDRAVRYCRRHIPFKFVHTHDHDHDHHNNDDHDDDHHNNNDDDETMIVPFAPHPPAPSPLCSPDRLAALNTPLSSVFAADLRCKQDARPNKINGTVGVLQTSDGRTLKLETTAHAQQTVPPSSNEYLPGRGRADFVQAAEQALGVTGAVASMQTLGGTHAVFLSVVVCDSLGISVCLPNLTWPNHVSIVGGDKHRVYPYCNEEGTELRFDDWLHWLNHDVAEGEAVLLHGCAHNPTGLDPTLDQWTQLASVFASRNLVALFDCAYRGLGTDWTTDMVGVHAFARQGVRMLVAVSFSKNLTAYNSRVGALHLVNLTDADEILRYLTGRCVRTTISNPPDDGAKLAAHMLGPLRDRWHPELQRHCDRIVRVRRDLCARLTAACPSRDWSYVARGHGLFCTLPVDVERLCTEHAVYLEPSQKRINLSALNEHNLDHFVHAVVDSLLPPNK